MQAFEYVSPASKEQVATLLGENAAILAGGTDLLALMKDYVVTPNRLVNIKQIESLRGISYQAGNGLRIGALTTIAELAEARTELAAYPALIEAANEAASPQIRNLATIGGNMCQRPRCWYFRNGLGLFPKTPDGKSMVLEGDNRYAAILGNDGPAYFVSPSTIAPVLISYGAKIRLFSGKGAGSGVREIPLEKFFVIPKSDNQLEHDFRPGEMVIELVVPPPVAESEGRRLRGSPEGGVRLAPGNGQRRSRNGWHHGEERSRRPRAGRTCAVGITGSGANINRQECHTRDCDGRRQRCTGRCQTAQSQ